MALIVIVPVIVLLTWLAGKFLTLRQTIRRATGKADSTSGASSAYNASSASRSSGSRQTQAGSQHRKIIPDGEGEYVSFEEVE